MSFLPKPPVFPPSPLPPVRPPDPGCSTLPPLDVIKEVLTDPKPKLPKAPTVEKR